MEPLPPQLHASDLAGLAEACADWGVFYLLGHRISPALINAQRAAANAFFAQPAERKAQVVRSASNPWGYYDQELTKNRRDWKEIFDVGPSHDGAQPQWPDGVTGFRSAIEEYAEAAHELALQVTSAILATLDAPAREIDGFRAHTSFLRLNRYPLCDNPASVDAPTVPLSGELGISHHTDAGALTVLDAGSEPGLQVLNRGRWVTLPVVADALVINVGDVVQVWSNDRYPAPVHRVLASANAERASAAYFLNPASDYAYQPLSVDDPAYRAIRWGEFRAGRAAGDYADLGAEVQIGDYRVGPAVTASS